jgi:hypothetical protein
LVDTNKDDKLDSEIAKRLDDLFGEGDASSNNSGALKADDAAADDEIFELEDVVANKTDAEPIQADNPLSELKNMVLSIDWEITDEVLSDFLSQIGDLKDIYKNEKIVLMFLQLLGSLGEYIKTNRGDAHPKTFKILNSVFARLEEVVLSEDMPELEKKKILQAEMNKYKQLRVQVSKKKAAEVSRRQAKSIQKQEPDLSTPKKKKSAMGSAKVSAAPAEENLFPDSAAAKPYDTLAEAVEELKQFIHTELRALKQELKILKNSR